MIVPLLLSFYQALEQQLALKEFGILDFEDDDLMVKTYLRGVEK